MIEANKPRVDRRLLKAVLSVVILLLVAIFIALSWQNSVALTSVAIRVKSGGKEPMDPDVLNLNAKHRLPDYKVQLRLIRKIFPRDLGTRLDTSATNWLEFPVPDLVALNHVQEIVLLEVDKVANDLIERVPVSGTDLQGPAFEYHLATTRSLELGIKWFFNTGPGKAITGAITIAFVILLLAMFK